ncbi:MAG: hypothetical protein WBV82_09875, partial [Myxococcaceae bacterium]
MRVARTLVLTSTIVMLALSTGAVGCGAHPPADPPCDVDCTHDAGALAPGAPDSGDSHPVDLDAGDTMNAGIVDAGEPDACHLPPGVADAGGTVDAGPTHEGMPDGGPRMSAVDFANGFIEALCRREARCGAYQDAGACQGHQTSPKWFENFVSPLDRALELSRVVIDEAGVPSCFAELESLSCDTRAVSVTDVASCAAALRGTQVAGERCLSWLECAASDFCDDSATCPGICTPRFGLGEPAPSAAMCQVGLRLASDSTCQPFAEVGESCGDKWDCAADLYCAQGTCAPLKLEGAHCTSSLECSVYLFCGNGGTCQQHPVLGEPCIGLCKFDFSCDSNTYAGPGTCAARNATGGACWTWLDCVDGLDCHGVDINAGQKGI